MLVLLIVAPSHRQEPPENPGRFSWARSQNRSCAVLWVIKLRRRDTFESVGERVIDWGHAAAPKDTLSRETAKLMVFKLVMTAAKTWRRLKGENQLPKVIQGIKFTNGVIIDAASTKSAA